ncbi:MAG: FmdB family zinc ribbon protein [Nitrospirales bacterium]
MYDYKCEKCGKDFVLARTLKAQESGPPFCPSCKSQKIERVFATFMAKTSRKS